jgi:hypothetical protein
MSSKGKIGYEFRQEKIIEDDQYRMFETPDFSEFEGRILTLVESWGLRDIQENAVKALLRKTIWQFWYEGVEPMGRKTPASTTPTLYPHN